MEQDRMRGKEKKEGSSGKVTKAEERDKLQTDALFIPLLELWPCSSAPTPLGQIIGNPISSRDLSEVRKLVRLNGQPVEDRLLKTAANACIRVCRSGRFVLKETSSLSEGFSRKGKD